MAYQFQTFSVGEVLAAAKMNQIEVNIRDHHHNNDGVAAIEEADFAAGVVDQTAMKTTTQTVTVNMSVGNKTNFAFTQSGTYAFLPRFSDVAGGAVLYADSGSDMGTVAYPTIAVEALVNSANRSVVMRYITASPPWDMGDGPMHLFHYLLIDNGTLTVLASSVAIDPAWNYLTQQLAFKATKPATVQEADANTGKRQQWITFLPKNAQELSQRVRTLKNAFRGLSMAQKVAPMPLFPHPWFGQDLTDKTVLLLDPVSENAARLAYLQDFGEADKETPSDLLSAGYLKFDTTPLSRNAPDGVVVVEPKWKWDS